MTVLLQSTFVGSNGSAWPSPWVGELQGGTTGGAVDIQSNRGRLRTNDGDLRVARADAVGVTASSCVLDYTVRFPAVAEHYLYLWARTSGGWEVGGPAPVNGYGVVVRAINNTTSTFGIQRRLDGGFFSLGSFAVPAGFATNTDYRVKFRLEGQLLRAKFWAASGSEPDWQVSVVDAAHSSGGVAIGLISGEGAASREAQFDDVTVTALVASSFEPSAWSGWSFTSTTNEEAISPPPSSTTPEWRVLHQGVPVPALLFSAGDLE